MGCLGNLLWFLLGGCLSGLGWLLAGALWCVTIVGIPVGLQCFKFASLCFFPFGKEIRYGGGAGLCADKVLHDSEDDRHHPQSFTESAYCNYLRDTAGRT